MRFPEEVDNSVRPGDKPQNSVQFSGRIHDLGSWGPRFNPEHTENEMIICVCKHIKDSDVERLKAEGLTLENIISKTGATTMCGTCKKSLDETYRALV